MKESSERTLSVIGVRWSSGNGVTGWALGGVMAGLEGVMIRRAD